MTASNPTVWLTLQAHDAPTLIDYYVETFGFVLAARYGQGETVDHAQLNWPHGSYVVTADPDGLYERVLQHKAEVVRPLAETDYGAREFTVRDPEGNLWSFGDYGGASSSAG